MSFAAPQVAASLALIRTYYPDWTADQVEKRLLSSARTISDTDSIPDEQEYGCSALDAAAALGWISSSEEEKSPDTDGSVYETWRMRL